MTPSKVIVIALLSAASLFALANEIPNNATGSQRELHPALSDTLYPTCVHCRKPIYETVYSCGKCGGNIGNTCRGNCPF